MRAGGYTVHQSLTAEAAAVLKLALGLARSRGHAQVTPLHVAFTLLGSSAASPSPPFTLTASPCAFDLLRRVCTKAHPGTGGTVSSHPAQCRALDLCFNVALNRLPTTSAAVGSLLSSSSSAGSAASSTPFAASLVQPNPTLSNALVAALKRAQANQRRGCVELQSQQPPPTSQQQQQPLLTIKVELDQLIVSILDDPSVSRVMREAGFSSAAIKTNLEEEGAKLLGLGLGSSTQSPSPAPAVALPSQFFLDPYGGIPTRAGDSGCGVLWPPQFLNHPNAEFESPCKEEDVRAILEVMLRKQGRRSNPVVVGDSVSAAEASVAELMRRLESGDVPDELRGAHVLRLHLSHVHVRLMTRADVDAWVTDLCRTATACTNTTKAALVVYVGDIRWAVDDDDDTVQTQGAPRYSPAEHMAAALTHVLGELRAAGRAWLVAAASYKTYMRCQRCALEALWALQPVSIPASAGLSLGLALGPRAATSLKDGKIAKLSQIPLPDSEPKQEDGVAALCVDCTRNFEREASAARAKAEGTNLALSCFPGWPQADEPQTSHTDDLMELRRKWSRLCQRVHLRCNQPARPSTARSSDPGLCLSFETPTRHGTTSEVNHQDDDVKTTLSLSLLPDSVETSSGEAHRHSSEDLDGSLTIKMELPFGDLKRKAESGQPPSESKRRRGSGCLDLNLCAEEEEEDAVDGSEGEPVPSDLTNDGEGRSGDATDSHS